MDNRDKRVLRDLATSMRKILQEDFSGRHEISNPSRLAWLWAIRLITERAIEVRKINSHIPSFLAIANNFELLRPSRSCLEDCRTLLMAPEYYACLSYDEVIGWFHQYWHDGERQLITASVIKSGYNKIDDKKVISRTQVYSEKYMSDYLLQNSLGALWLSGHPETALRSAWLYYVDEQGTARGSVKSAGEITIIDPACGAGNFLLAAFDMLYQMYLEEDPMRKPLDICSSILNNNIFGIDIDAKAIEVARTALWLKAVEKAPDIKEHDISNLCEHLIAICEDKDIAGVAELGSLLHSDSLALCGKLGGLLRRRYQVVITNPPYLDKRDYGKTVREYLRRYYRSGAGNLYTAFILRCLELSEAYVSMITPQTFLFIKSYTSLRQELFAQAYITTLAQLGLGAFQGAVVDTAMFILKRKKTGEDNTLQGLYFKLVTAGDKNKALLDTIAKKRENQERMPDNVFRYARQSKDNVIGAPLYYWLGPGLLETIENSPQLQDYADIVLGMKTSDNRRFVRYWWEIAAGNRNLAQAWLPYEKEASGYRFFRNSAHYVLWTQAARDYYQSHYSGQLPNPKYWLKPGIVYGLVSSKAFTAKLLPAGHMSDMAASCVFPKNPEDTMFILALINSKVYQWLLKLFNPTVNYQPVDLQRLPVPISATKIKESLADLAEEAVRAAESLRKLEITDRQYSLDAGSILPLKTKLPELIAGIWSDAIRYVLAQDMIDIKLIECLNLAEKEINDIEKDIGIISSRCNNNKHINCFKPVSEPIDNIPAEKRLAIKLRLRQLYTEDWPKGINYFPPEFIIKSACELRIHPLNVYKVMVEGIEQDGWRCPTLEKFIIEDYFSAVVLKLLGFNWPGEEKGLPEKNMGFFIIGQPSNGHSLYRQVCCYIELFDDIGVVEEKFLATVGTSLRNWLEKVFFTRHVKQFRRRPIAWQISNKARSNGPVLSWLVNYHKINELTGNTPEFVSYNCPKPGGSAGRALIDIKDILAKEFDYSLGVRANIVQFQLAGVLPVKVLAIDDVQQAIADYRVWARSLL